MMTSFCCRALSPSRNRYCSTMEAPPPPAENGGTPTAPSSNDKATIAKLSVQLKRLNDANAKYKNLLKLAKERIQSQDEEVQSLKSDKEALEERLIADEKEAAKHIDLDETSRKSNNNAAADNAEINIVRVCQRIRGGSGAVDDETIWALMELEKVLKNDDVVVQPAYKEWIRFDTESELHDYIRRDTGEPLQLPPYSLSPEQSARIQQEAATQVSRITEDFRRFRVKSELARKQADAQIRDLQSLQARSAAQRIEQGGTNNSGSTLGATGGAAGGGGAVVERLKAEMAAQEAHWKESYDALLKENQALQSAGSEALLAAQWRQRYETCVKEKEQLQMRLDNGNGTSSHYPAANGGGAGGDDKYEAKYRDLKGKVLFCWINFNHLCEPPCFM